MNGSRVLSGETLILGAALMASAMIGILAISNGATVLALPLLLVGGVVLFGRPVIGLFLMVAMIPLESGLMLGGRSAAALIGMAVFGVWAAQKLMRREPLLPLVSPGLVQLAVLFLALGCLSMLWAQNPQGMQHDLFLVFQLMLLAVLVLDLTSSWKRAAGVAKYLVLAGTVAALLTLEQYFVGGARRAGAGVSGGINRTAATLVTILPFAFFLWRSREARPWRLLGLTYIGVSAVAVSTTLSRTNFLLFPLVVVAHFAFMARNRGERSRVLVLGALAVLVVSFMPMDAVRDRAETIVPFLARTVGAEQISEEEYLGTYTARSFFMRMGVEMFKDRPVLGSGYGNFQAQSAQYQWRVPGSPYEWVRPGRSPHSSHIGILVGLGLVGFAIWIGFFALAIAYVWGVWRRDPDGTSDRVVLAQAIGVAVVLQLLLGFSSEVHHDKIVWLVLGLAVAVHRLAGKQAPRGASPPPPRASAE